MFGFSNVICIIFVIHRDWCHLQADPSKMQSVVNVIEGARVCVMQTNGVEMLKGIQSSLSPRSVFIIFRRIRISQ